ncbi:unnamed protein product [Oppiella nova]|uniref:Uncharacterized protein n=1 Tax=Oppiella nova TaxID=334625 RepID=A0A7R9M4D6_9ACAR|nr:unnamed protein product [Oppiella nova]CAG2170464.1 unnamed protein product [Oppiella nova]
MSTGHNLLFVTFDDIVYGLGSNIEGKLGGLDFVLAVNTDNNVIFSFGPNNWGQLGRHVVMDKNCLDILRHLVFNEIKQRHDSEIVGKSETHDKLNNSIFEKSFDVINELGEGGYGQD